MDGWASRRVDGRASRSAIWGAEKGTVDHRPARSSRQHARDRGATAVEFALLFPLLMLIVFGTIDFGRVLNTQITLTQAAREGARLDALGVPNANVVARAQGAATGLTPVNVTVTGCPPGAGPTADAVVAVSYQFSFVTPIGAIAGLIGGSGGLGSPVTLNAQGVMPCET
jgi:Flp pilus assembly protein TadG